MIKGDKILPNRLNALDFTKAYIKSDNYKSKLKSSNYKNVDNEIKSRFSNLENVEIINQKGLLNKVVNTLKGKRTSTGGSNYDDEDKSIVMDYNQVDELRVPYNSILAHELGHVEIDDGILSPITDDKKFKPTRLNNRDASELYNRLRHKRSLSILDHDSEPNENKSDFNGLRYELYKQDIFNSLKSGKFTEEHLDKLDNSFIKKRLLRKYSKKDIIWILNNIASNKKLNNENLT
jgi:hypothetical protein